MFTSGLPNEGFIPQPSPRPGQKLVLKITMMVMTKMFINVMVMTTIRRMVMTTIRHIGDGRVFSNHQERLGASSRKTLSVGLCSPTISGY